MRHQAPLAAALEYAQRGWPVFPVWWPEKGKCACGKPDCPHPAKHPIGTLAPHGRNSATTDAETIKEWWGECPEANVGVVTGQESGLVVVDIDPRNGGEQSLNRLERERGALPATPTANTGGGGLHYFFKRPGNGYIIKGQSGLAGYGGIDLKADGGYIVAPPSRHISGDQYTWRIGPEKILAPIPSWLVEMINQDTNLQPKPAAPAKEVIPQGQRNVTLTSLAGSMRRRGMSLESIEAALLAENQRCDPPLSDKEISGIAKSVSLYYPAKGDDPLKAIKELLKDLTKETPRDQVRDVLENLAPSLARLDEVKFERLWVGLDERLNLKGTFFTALRREIKETRNELRKASPVKEGDPELSPEEELKTLKPLAEPLAQCPDILGKAVGVLNRLGLAGQEREAKIIYLALTSRIFERPVNVAVKGPSSGGKSFLVERCLEQFPKSAYYALSAMSERALAYSQEPLSHRFLIIYEAAGLGSDFAQYLMRSLLSEGRLRYETVEDTGKGQKARLIEREGPTGLIVTTTKAGLHPENETRMLSLEVDDSPEQTRAVLLAHVKGEKEETVDLAPFQALQRILELERPQVVIPYAAPLAQGCDPTAVRLRRDFPQVLTLVKAHAVLHAHHRPQDDQGRVMATLEDYRLVYHLVADLVAYGTGQKVSDSMRETVAAVAALLGGDPDHPGVTVKDVAKQLKRDESTASRRVRVALNTGYLENKETRKYAPYKLVLGAPLPDNQGVLPLPDTIEIIISPPENSATLQPTNYYTDNSYSYVLHPHLQPTCNLQPSKGLHGCNISKHSATLDATVNTSKLLEKDGTVAGLHGNQEGIDEEKISTFSPEHLATILKDGEEIEL